MTAQVFLSCSVRDRHRVERLRHALELYNVATLPAVGMLTPGTRDWLATFEDSIEQSCCVLVCLSPNTMFSRWVQLGLEWALVCCKPILPILIDGKPDHILLASLEGDDWFDIRWSKHYRAEIEALVPLIRQHAHAATREL